jgi:hypothetical protein
MRTGLRLVGLAAGAVFALSACQQSASPPPSGVKAARSPATTPRSTPTHPPTPTPAPVLAVEKVGAAASASGFMAFAVITNPSGQTAADVKVEIAALTGSGEVLARRTGSIPRIGPGQREALALPFPVSRTLPARFSGTVAGVRWSSDLASDLAQVASASFVQDARTPAVRVHLVNRGPAADRVAVTAVCWDAAGNIRGGGTRTVMVGPESQGHDVVIQVSLSTVPTGCDAFGVSTG